MSSFDIYANTIIADILGIALLSPLLYFVFKAALKNALKELVKESVISALEKTDKSISPRD